MAQEFDPAVIHVYREPAVNICGESGPAVSLAEALDPDGPHFTCRECWLVLAGREPMSGGGS